ncbi:MAG: GtrA family protein [Alphaproteobacteria bacterium]|nr:GtrA family protein [Alphaproteobacteria bacterium]
MNISLISGRLRQFRVYVAVGIVTALVDVGVMQGLIFAEIPPLWASSFGFFIGFLVNFLLHSRVTFASHHNLWVMGKFSLVVLLNYLLTQLFVKISLDGFDMALVGKIASLPVVAVNGFFLCKYWVFARHDQAID